MANAWITLVKKTFSEGLKKDKSYSYKQAMMDAKLKKNGSKKGGQADDEVVEDEMSPIGEAVIDEETTESTTPTTTPTTTPAVGGKSRKSKKSKKSKTSKKSKKAGKKSKKTRKARK